VGEVSSGIKANMDYFYDIPKVAAMQICCLFVWMSNEMCKVRIFSDWEKKNVAREVNDVAIGKENESKSPSVPVIQKVEYFTSRNYFPNM
jgi:hypothetical protein